MQTDIHKNLIIKIILVFKRFYMSVVQFKIQYILHNIMLIILIHINYLITLILLHTCKNIDFIKYII